MIMSPSRAQSEIFSTNQFGPQNPSAYNRYAINYFLLPNFIIHVVGLATLGTLWYYLRFTSAFPYHHRVFYCRDVLLYKPDFRPEDFEVYVSYTLLYILAFCIPPILIFIGEIMFWLFSSKQKKIVLASCAECKIHLITRRIFRFISVFLFGAFVTQIFVDTIKLMTGYQRPYFLSLCNISLASCTAPLEHSPSPSPHLACGYKNADELRYAWLTFPSLHAAFSSYSACFASCYIYYMINLRGAPLLRPMLIFTFIGMTLVDSFSRINGYKNHLQDIWVGWIIGSLIALFLCYSVLCFQEVYHSLHRQAIPLTIQEPIEEERNSPFFSWFRLPRVHAPSVKEEYIVYEEELPSRNANTEENAKRQRINQDRTYEVTTTTETFHRTIAPPGINKHGILNLNNTSTQQQNSQLNTLRNPVSNYQGY